MEEQSVQRKAPSERSVAPTPQDWADLLALDAKINALLPPQYQNCYETVKPGSMGSAGLKFGTDGKVAWNEIWTSFCHLALAGGPPHRGTLLESVLVETVLAEPEKYQQVVEEIGRGLWLVTGLPILPGIAPGWVAVICHSEEMATWLVRAMVAENVLARREHRTLYLPAGPHFRLAKEIKNVVTALAKACHYWTAHMPASQQAAVATAGLPFLEPAPLEEALAATAVYKTVRDEMERSIRQQTELQTVPSRSLGWVGVQCDTEEMAAWLLRAVVVENVLARREGSVLYLPVSPKFAVGDQGRELVKTFAQAGRLWSLHVATKAHRTDLTTAIETARLAVG